MAFFVVVRIQSTDDRGTPKICSINIPEWQTRVLSSWRHILAYVHKWEKFAISNANWFWRLWSTITLQLLLYIIQLWIRSSYPTIDRLAFEFEIIIILCCHCADHLSLYIDSRDPAPVWVLTHVFIIIRQKSHELQSLSWVAVTVVLVDTIYSPQPTTILIQLSIGSNRSQPLGDLINLNSP